MSLSENHLITNYLIYGAFLNNCKPHFIYLLQIIKLDSHFPKKTVLFVSMKAL